MLSMKKGIIALLFTCLMGLSAIGFASPASDAFAKEDKIAMPLAQAIVEGKGDFSSYKKMVDPKLIPDVNKFAEARKNIPDFAKIKQIAFATYERGMAGDRVTYAGVADKNIYLICIVFNPNNGLVIGSTINKLEVKQ